jgi:hypothetical protein
MIKLEKHFIRRNEANNVETCDLIFNDENKYLTYTYVYKTHY